MVFKSDLFENTLVNLTLYAAIDSFKLKLNIHKALFASLEGKEGEDFEI